MGHVGVHVREQRLPAGHADVQQAQRRYRVRRAVRARPVRPPRAGPREPVPQDAALSQSHRHLAGPVRAHSSHLCPRMLPSAKVISTGPVRAHSSHASFAAHAAHGSPACAHSRPMHVSHPADTCHRALRGAQSPMASHSPMATHSTVPILSERFSASTGKGCTHYTNSRHVRLCHDLALAHPRRVKSLAQQRKYRKCVL